MSLGRDQEEVLKRHRLRRRARCQPQTLAFTEEERNGISHLHARKMDTNAGSGTCTEGVESCSGVGRMRFGNEVGGGGEPAVGIEAVSVNEVVWWVGLWRRKLTLRDQTRYSHRDETYRLA
jgi:hypothetical protein